MRKKIPWIDVSKELPPVGESVLIWVRDFRDEELHEWWGEAQLHGSGLWLSEMGEDDMLVVLFTPDYQPITHWARVTPP